MKRYLLLVAWLAAHVPLCTASSSIVSFTLIPCLGDSGRAVAWGDDNGDGIWDAVVSRLPIRPLQLYRGDGDGNFTALAPFDTPSPYRYGGLAWGDYDGDGVPDLAACNPYGKCATYGVKS